MVAGSVKTIKVHRSVHADAVDVIGSQKQSEPRNTTADVTTPAKSNIGMSGLLQTVSNTKGLKVGHINIRSLLLKIEEIRHILVGQPIDILSVNETFLTDSILDLEKYRYPGILYIGTTGAPAMVGVWHCTSGQT